MARLKKKDITLQDVYRLSIANFAKKNVDNKAVRASLDIVSAKITKRNNVSYNASTKSWEQSGREVRFDFQVKTRPVSYKKKDTVKTHVYPVFFLIKNLDQGVHSAFRWRTGSFKRPILTSKKGKYKETANTNIKNGVQMQFFFDLMALLSSYNLLFGPNTTNKRLPLQSNPSMSLFFDKHAFFIVDTILFTLLTVKKGFIIGRLFGNEAKA